MYLILAAIHFANERKTEDPAAKGFCETYEIQCCNTYVLVGKGPDYNAYGCTAQSGAKFTGGSDETLGKEPIKEFEEGKERDSDKSRTAKPIENS